MGNSGTDMLSSHLMGDRDAWSTTGLTEHMGTLGEEGSSLVRDLRVVNT